MTAAYDYQAQRWVTGERAASLRRQQWAEELELLDSDQGEDFARFAGITDRVEAITNLRALLAQEATR